VSAETTLQEIAIPDHSLTWPGRVLLFTGEVTTPYPLEHGGYVVNTGDGYRFVYLAFFQRAGAGSDWFLMLVGLVAGGWLVVRGYRELPPE
jgi:hypothetical protein